MSRARIYVSLKTSVFDPQGTTIEEALHSLGYGDVEHVRQGKYFEVTLPAVEPERARTLAEEIAGRVLSNPVIESFRVEVEP
jgi:phosphoribosylformylglycinamidine synthase subunit PurS